MRNGQILTFLLRAIKHVFSQSFCIRTAFLAYTWFHELRRPTFCLKHWPKTFFAEKMRKSNQSHLHRSVTWSFSDALIMLLAVKNHFWIIIYTTCTNSWKSLKILELGNNITFDYKITRIMTKQSDKQQSSTRCL